MFNYTVYTFSFLYIIYGIICLPEAAVKQCVYDLYRLYCKYGEKIALVKK
jgi:hypothetical protein